MRAARSLVLAVSLALGCGSPSQPAPPPAAAAKVALDRPHVVVIHAEWCAACHRVAPVVAWLRTEYAGRVTFVDLDVTDDDAARRSASVAEPLGLGPFFAQWRATPGITILGRDGKTVHHFTVEGRPAPYRVALDEAFASFTAPP
jgi:thiol-disulfide isomerase/thioredoxin